MNRPHLFRGGEIRKLPLSINPDIVAPGRRMKLHLVTIWIGSTAMKKLLYAATVAGTCLLSASSAQAQCACGSGHYGYGPAAYYGSYYGYAALPAYYGYAAPVYSDTYPVYEGYGGYYGGGGYGYGTAAVGVRRGFYGYGARVGVGRIGYGYRAIGVSRVGWRSGYGYRAVGVSRFGIGGRGFRR
jgi:hypothetical protein